MLLNAGVSSLMGGINLGSFFGGGPNTSGPNLEGMSQYSGVNANTRLAEGGYVDGPTNALIGEGGESEYVIPESKMSEAIERYSQGARGDAVIAGGGETSIEGSTGGAGGGTINISYTSEVINNTEYVTAGEFQSGMAAAANAGAKQGEAKLIHTLKNNPSFRKRIGI